MFEQALLPALQTAPSRYTSYHAGKIKLGYEQYRQVHAPVGLLMQPVLLAAKWLQPSQ